MRGEENKTRLTQQVFQKLKEFCAYQERCHLEVRVKAFELGLYQVDLAAIIAELIEGNFLNEERFAIQYAGGKFRINKWGRAKIRYALRQKQISDYCIRKALSQIDPADYWATLRRLAEKKYTLLAGTKNEMVKKAKLKHHLGSRGFESDLVDEVIAGL